MIIFLKRQYEERKKDHQWTAEFEDEKKSNEVTVPLP